MTAVDRPTPVDDARASDLKAMWQREIARAGRRGGKHPLTADHIERLLAVDWTAEDTRRVAGLAQWGLVVSGGYVEWAAQRAVAPSLNRVARDLAFTSAALIHRGVERADAFAWMGVYVGCPPGEARRMANEVLSLRGYQSMAAIWVEAAGPLAPLAWAAGLSVEEARRTVLDAATLRGLAALRGYRLPAD